MLAFLKRLLGIKPPPPPAPAKPLDEDPGLIGDILRLGEATGGDAAEALQEQTDVDDASSKP